MPKNARLEGLVYDRLTVIRFLEKEERGYKNNVWHCECICGNTLEVSTGHLKGGNVASCGCLKKDTYVCNRMSGNYTYSSWNAMITRCSGYDQNYTDKGRKVCDRWLQPSGKGFLNFLEDMGERPEGLTLERINNSLDYFPENCKWDTVGNQCYNRDIFKNSTSGRTGVHQRKDNSLWRAFINVQGKRIHLGTYRNFEDAVKARESAESEYYGFIKG